MVRGPTADHTTGMTLLSGKVWDFGHFWDAPHRPLFLASFICAFFTVAWWPLGVGIGIPAPAFEPAILWHVHELIFGFAAAAVGGYLLTALPSWTGLPLVRGTALKVLLLFWVFSRLAIALADHVPLWLLNVLNAGFFLWLAGILCHQFLLAGTYRKIGFVGVVLVLGGAEVLFLRAAMVGHHSISLNLIHWVLIGFTLLMTVIGTRAIPAFTNNWFDRIGRIDLKIQEVPFLRRLTLGLLVITITGMLAGQFDVAYGALIFAALTILWIMRRWKTATALANPLLAAQHLAFLWVPIGQITIGVLWFFPSIYPLSDAVHTITIGAMSGLIMAIAGRAASHHENGDMCAGKGFVLGALMIWITTWIRLIAPLVPQHSAAILATAAVVWCLGWAVFIVGFLPAVTGPVIRPVLSGKKNLNTDDFTFRTEKSI